MSRITTEFTDDGFGIIRMLGGQNRLNNNFLTEFNSALDRVLSNKNCKALITTSEGKFYSNGLDLEWMAKQPPEVVLKFRTWLVDTLWRLIHFPIPTVAAINGHAFAGGAFLAIAHDYRVMCADRGWISWNEVLLKLPSHDARMQEIIRVKLLHGKAKREAVVFARRITATEATKLDLVDCSVDKDQLIPEAKNFARHALGNNEFDRDALSQMKRNIYLRQIYVAKL